MTDRKKMPRPAFMDNSKSHFVTTAVDGHKYLCIYHLGQEAQAIGAINAWAENSELNLPFHEAEKLAGRVRSVAEYQAEKAARKRRKGGGR